MDLLRPGELLLFTNKSSCFGWLIKSSIVHASKTWMSKCGTCFGVFMFDYKKLLTKCISDGSIRTAECLHLSIHAWLTVKSYMLWIYDDVISAAWAFALDARDAVLYALLLYNESIPSGYRLENEYIVWYPIWHRWRKICLFLKMIANILSPFAAWFDAGWCAK